MRVYFDLVRDTLAELKSAGRLRPVDLTVGAFSVLGMILWLPRWFRQDGRLTQEQVANDIAKMALNGLIAPARLHHARRPRRARSAARRCWRCADPRARR